MHSVLRRFDTAYIQAHNLMPFLTEYTNPMDFLSRLVKKGELTRLKNGFFVITERIEKMPVPYEKIANLLYGPSYISYEWALSQYGMIPEGVYEVTSASASKSKNYETKLGTFQYQALSHSRYAIGISQRTNASGNYLIATPEKALADLVHLKSAGLSANDLLVDLIEGRRIEEDFLKKLDKKHLLEIEQKYRSQSVSNLVKVVGLL